MRHAIETLVIGLMPRVTCKKRYQGRPEGVGGRRRLYKDLSTQSNGRQPIWLVGLKLLIAAAKISPARFAKGVVP
jgi:hypothetical protein